MKLADLNPNITLGMVINHKDLKTTESDYFYLTLDNITDGSIRVNENPKYIRRGKLIHNYYHRDSNNLQYGDYLLYKIEDDFRIIRYENESTIPVIASEEFIIIRCDAAYLNKFLSDSDNRLYFYERLKKIYNELIEEGYGVFLENIGNVEIKIKRNLKIKAKFSDAETKIEDHDLKRQRLNPDEINIISKPMPLFNAMRRIQRKEINLFTDFQRLQNLWTPHAKSRLIESILIKFPIPAFYFDTSEKGNWLVIDGLQRLSSIYQFYDNRFSLQDLEYLPDLNGKYFRDLNQEFKDRLEETNINTLQIQKGTPVRVKYSLFERINTEGKPLKPMELRHAINSFGDGKPSKFIKELTELEIFTTVWGTRKKDRMQDREAVLSFVAFKLTAPHKYKPSFKEFLDESMAEIYKKSTITLNEMRESFGNSLVLLNQIYGEDLFIVLDRGNKRTFNSPLFEILTVLISELNEEQREIIKNKQEDFKSFVQELVLDESTRKFFWTNEEAYSYEGVQERFEIMENIINLILGNND